MTCAPPGTLSSWHSCLELANGTCLSRLARKPSAAPPAEAGLALWEAMLRAPGRLQEPTWAGTVRRNERVH